VNSAPYALAAVLSSGQIERFYSGLSVLVSSANYAALPFYLAGGLKIVYDLLVYRDFRNLKPPEEQRA